MPDADPAAHSAHVAEPGAARVVTPEAAAFCQSGVSVIIALGGKDAAPVVGLGCGCRVFANGQIRLLFMRSRNLALVSAAERKEPVAATFSQPISHRTIQIKGANARLSTPTEEDRQAARFQLAGLQAELEQVGYSPRFNQAYCHVDLDDLIAIDFDTHTAFAQTPGPGAGAELKS